MRTRSNLLFAIAAILLSSVSHATGLSAADLLTITDGTVTVGIDREKGAAITWLASQQYPRNMVNLADPGRLIQQSYYAGKVLDRTSDGQHPAWSPWSWNPIQGGGVGSTGGEGTWARVTAFQKQDNALYSETVPKLWDMPDEEADAVMRQWTTLEPNIAGVVRVRCELQAMRKQDDTWGEAVRRPQEVPACYFTRNFADVRSYLGDGKWRVEQQPPGPPWGHTNPPRKAMAFFEPSGQGIAVFSPASSAHWNFGPHAGGRSADPTAGPCMHVAPIDFVVMGYNSIYRYRYWLIVGTETEIAARLDPLWTAYSNEVTQLAEPTP